MSEKSLSVEGISPCTGEIHPQARAGIALFDAHEYFDAHEALEAAWREETGPIRDLYRGILQVAVAYYHLLKGNYTGARKMFMRCRLWLAPIPRDCLGIDLAQFKRDYETVEAALFRAGPDRTEEVDRSLLKPIPWIEPRKW